MQTFAELLTLYMDRTGIRDAELARRIPVSRQTLVRWKEGVTSRPRYREDVVRCGELLRLSDDERDELLLAAGFSPEAAPSSPQTEFAESVESDEIHDTPLIPQSKGASFSSRRLLLGAVAGSVLVIAVVIALYTIRYWDSTAYPTAVDGESLIVLAPFVNYTAGGQGFNVAGRLRAAVNSELHTAGLTTVRTVEWPKEIDGAASAEDAILRSNAALVIWGEYDSGRVVARFTASRSSGSSALAEHAVDITTSPGELPATINIGLTDEVRYVALVTLGQLYLEQDDFDGAKPLLIRASTPPPLEAAALANLRFLLGSAFLGGDLADYDEAIWLFTQVLAVQPRSVEALNSRALAYLGRDRDGDPALAVDDLNRALTIRPERAASHLNLAVAYVERNANGDLDRAVDSLNEAISIQSDYASAYVNRAGVYVARGAPGDIDRALDDVETALEIDPEMASAHLNRGNAYLGRGSADDTLFALEEFTRAIQLTQDSPLAYYNRSLAYSELGDLSRSVQDLERAQELSPNEDIYNRTLCWQLAVSGDAESGRPFCKLAFEYEPDGLSRDAMGLANALTGRTQQAIADFESFVAWVDASPRESCGTHYRDSRTAWINALRAGEVPFDNSDLYDLRIRPVLSSNTPC